MDMIEALMALADTATPPPHQVQQHLNKEEQYMHELMAQSKSTVVPKVEQQIKGKYAKFTRFSWRDTFKEARKKRRRNIEESKPFESDIGIALSQLLTSFMGISSEEEAKLKLKRKVTALDELPGIKSERRERFKKSDNMLHIIKHYMEREGFKPREESNHLMKSLAQLREFTQYSSLEATLKRLYKLMNEAVDFDEMRFLCLLVLLTGQICLEHRDLGRSFYFFNQGRVFTSYAEQDELKGQALVSMAVVSLQAHLYSEAISILKKGLQYAWKTRNNQLQLRIYDLMGSAYYYDGNQRQAQYYHHRYTQGQLERADSAVKLISAEMLNEYDRHVKTLEKDHLTSLFLEYLSLPIVDTSTHPPPEPISGKTYSNYDERGDSPRRKRSKYRLDIDSVPPHQDQIQRLLREDYEFRTQIPNPDIQRNFVAESKYGRARKTISFEQTTEYNKLINREARKGRKSLGSTKVYTVEERVRRMMSETPNSRWWEEMKDRVRNDQVQKVGHMRDRVFNSHLSYNKYPEERRHSLSLRQTHIKRSYNKVLLDWIDPSKGV